MKAISLTGDTFLYAVDRCGGSYLYGLQASVTDSSWEHLKLIRDSAQAELLQKGYADIDFDGNVMLQDEVRKTICECMDIADVVVINGKIKGKQLQLTLYRKVGAVDAGAYVLEWDGDTYCLYQCTLEELLARLTLTQTTANTRVFRVDATTELPEEHFRLSSALLLRKDRNAIIEGSASKESAGLILDALGEQGNIILVRKITNDQADGPWESFIYGENGILQLQMVYTAKDELVDFVAASFAQVKESIRNNWESSG